MLELAGLEFLVGWERAGVHYACFDMDGAYSTVPKYSSYRNNIGGPDEAHRSQRDISAYS
jgi:hypothetical protein